MTDISTEPGKGRLADPEARLTNDVAHAMWMASLGPDIPKDAESRQAAWKEARKARVQIARGVMKRLARKGITLTRSDVTDPDAEADEADASGGSPLPPGSRGMPRPTGGF